MGIVRLTSALLIVLLLAGFACWASAQEEGVEVTVVGESAHSFDEAKEAALRNAVEMGAGTTVFSDTRVRDFQLMHDTIVSRAAGYVRGYDILSREEIQGIYRVKIRAVVSLGEVEEDWGALQILIVRKGRPNMLIVVEEDTTGVSSTGNVAEYKLRDMCDQLGLELVDDDMLASIGDRDRVRAELVGDERKAAAVAAQLYAGYAVIGRAHVRADSPTTTYGVTHTPVSADIDLKIVAADNAQLLASKSASGRRSSQDPVNAARLAVQEAAEDVGRRALFRMLEHWARDLDIGTSVLLAGTRIETEVLNFLIDRLRMLDGVKAANVIDHNPEATTVKVVTRLETVSLAKEIPALSGERIAVAGYSPGRVEIVMKADERALRKEEERVRPGTRIEPGPVSPDEEAAPAPRMVAMSLPVLIGIVAAVLIVALLLGIILGSRRRR